MIYLISILALRASGPDVVEKRGRGKKGRQGDGVWGEFTTAVYKTQ